MLNFSKEFLAEEGFEGFDLWDGWGELGDFGVDELGGGMEVGVSEDGVD